jgi:carbamoyl-phosphate synthase large subunit
MRLLRDLYAGLGGGRLMLGDVGGGRMVSPRCLSRTVEDGLEDAAIFYSGHDPGPGGGFETEVNCIRAVEAWKGDGGTAVLYTPNPFMALLGAELADAVFIGSPGVDALLECAGAAGARKVALHFGGSTALHGLERVRRMGLAVMGMEHGERSRQMERVLEDLKSAGLPVVKYEVSEGIEAGEAALGRLAFPVLATCAGGDGEERGLLVYSREDGLDFLRGNPSERVLWREIKEEALELQVEAVANPDGDHLVLLWEQLDEAGICNADGLGVYPPFYVTSEQKRMASALAARAIDVLGMRGNLSMRMFLCNGDAVIYDLSAGASANLPFMSRASSVPLAACGVMALGSRNIVVNPRGAGCSAVRAPLIPFREIAGMDILPSPGRRSTGAVMGMASESDIAVAKALWSEGLTLRPGGKVFLSVANREKRRAVLLGRELQEAGYALMATRGTSRALASSGIEVETVNKLREGRPNILDYIRNGDVEMVVNVPRGKHPHSDGFYIRAASARHGVPCVTSMEVALALARGLREAVPRHWEVRPLAEYASVRHEVGG